MAYPPMPMSGAMPQIPQMASPAGATMPPATPPPPPQKTAFQIAWEQGQADNLPMEPEEIRKWWARIELDRRTRKTRSDQWEALLKRYLPPNVPTGTGGMPVALNSNIHFRNAHLKMAEVWSQLPELHLTPLRPLASLPPDPQTGQALSGDEVVDLKRAVLSKYLGRDFANVKLTIREALFDIFATQGIAATKICYESDSTNVPAPEPAPMIPGSILGLQQPPPQPTAQPVTVNERWRWYRFSGAKLGIPTEFRSTDYDEAPYLFMEFVEALNDASKKKYNLPLDFKSNVSRDEFTLTKDLDHTDAGKEPLVHGIEVWLRAAQFDGTIANSQLFRRLVLVEGMKDKIAIYRNSPYQSVDDQGRLTDDSMVGNPIHPIVLRVASDMAWIPSDAAFTDPLVSIENTYAQQDVKLRDANLPRFLHSAALTKAIDKLKNADTGQGAEVADDVMRRGMTNLISPLPHLEKAQSDVMGRERNDRAIEQTLGLSMNQAGATNSTIRSATEVATIQANVSVRLRDEQNELLDRYLRGVRKFDALIMRYFTDQDWIEVVGADGQRTMRAFTNAHISGKFAYDALPDSQLNIDQATRIKRMTDFVTFFAKSPFMDQMGLAQLGTREFGFPVSQLVKQPTPPPQPPPPHPNVSLALKAADLGMPEVQIVLKQLGIDLPPLPSPQLQAEMAREQAKGLPHGGAADKADLVDKKHSDNTGNQVGSPPVGNVQPAPQVAPTQMVQ